ncbi:Zn(II)2Cys6 transcription factor [Aspergillus ellipticus CBS 707.79]|uniref:Zn(II)2Cys6 transcription factor n=1 Tax=Aspergillus ellipticus CBS 707.79 TaxID=1448320 RepID=A0A319D5R2_9EURO|nr:Zn(II)2Cys6 transcription factor [Aspergillus ellipticus CBS 707.79]
MPRPKVHPANRLRAYEACLACRSTKKRCSGTFPCAKCIRLGRADTCVPTPRSAPHNNHGAAAGAGSQQTPTLGAGTFADQPNNDFSFQPHESNHDPAPSSPETLHKTHPRLLRNLRGERVYVGKAASLSFLQLVRDTVSQYIGPSQFSHNMKSEDMLETETPHDVPSALNGKLDSYQLLGYYRVYSSATSGFISVLSDAEAMQALDSLIEPDSRLDKTRMALADMIIAIGAQSSKRNPAAERLERFFFSRAQRTAFEGMLENPSLELVRLFLLMSFYMLGACRRNAAFMYLGVAVRAAMALGLHLTELADGVPTPEQHQRARVWMSVYILDLLVSSILGRPTATAALRSEMRDSSIPYPQPESHLSMSLVASYKISGILDEIIARMYSKEGASAEAAESLLKRLKRWSDDLPEPLVEPPSTDFDEPAARRHIIGNLHIACTYHFAVISVTRPFLISALGVRLARLHNGSAGRVSDESLQDEPAHSNLATACTDSALYMIQTCSEVHRTGLLLGNMCIMKAFVFAAALVLGFSMFSQKETDPSLEQAYRGALEILRMLSQQSAQAGHYYEILSYLGNAIAEQRQRLMQHSQQSKNRYVSKLFSLDDRRPSAEIEGTIDPLSNTGSPALPSQAGFPDSWSDFQRSALVDSLDVDASFLGLEGMELPIWDSFPFLGEPFQLQGRMGEAD